MTQKILIKPETLEHSYIPDDLPRREKERNIIFEQLSDFFKLNEPFFSWIIYGHSGVGKTVLSRRISEDIKKELGNEVFTVYVNCRYSRKIYRILIELVKQIERSVPDRGLSKDDLLTILFQLTAEKTGKLLIILDELGTLFVDQEGMKTRDVLYSISRFSEKYTNLHRKLQLAVIAIVSKTHEYTFFQWLDKATRASFIKYEINLERYSKQDLIEILDYRASLAFKPGTVFDDAIDLIASFAADQGEGNARIAIDILKNAGRLSDKLSAGYLGVEHVRSVLKYHPDMSRVDSEIFESLDKHKLVLLLSIIRALREFQSSYITRTQLEQHYHAVCEEYYEKPRKTTQLLRYLKELGRELHGLVEVEVSGKDQRGRSTRIRINVPLDSIEKHVLKVLERPIRGEF